MTCAPGRIYSGPSLCSYRYKTMKTDPTMDGRSEGVAAVLGLTLLSVALLIMLVA